MKRQKSWRGPPARPLGSQFTSQINVDKTEAAFEQIMGCVSSRTAIRGGSRGGLRASHASAAAPQRRQAPNHIKILISALFGGPSIDDSFCVLSEEEERH